MLKFLWTAISQLNSDFDHVFELINGFYDQKSEWSTLNRSIVQLTGVVDAIRLPQILIENI